MDSFYDTKLRCIESVKTILPEIEGVEWTVLIERAEAEISYEVRVVAGFKVDGRDKIEAKMPEILQKIHQIISNGQVKLELE